jgi:hypothetical protein
MSAAEALKAARAAGVSLRVDGDDLLLEAPAAPPATVLMCFRDIRPKSSCSCGRLRAGGRPRTGRPTSTSVPRWPSSAADWR